ncbi:Hypothetical protein, putative [Bodo saltans]|uniref:Uncharacterized protein n=1 Tax=Bodo saltans TaxID=75058 RepID=A0A0S4KKK6_BODSA|nr:Hypothetical protein, putative [Bodo saltans]|eukprot:CUI15127.1 Hypothetical protein, putative [Bodo saltans]
MIQYSNYHWHYNFPQGMEAPRRVNRFKEAPFTRLKTNTHRYQGVWVDLEMATAYRVALAPQLEKLALGRQVPSTPLAEAVADFEKYAPLLEESKVKEAWIAKVAQLGGLQRSSEGVQQLWNQHLEGQYGVTAAAAASPSLPVVLGVLFSYAASGNAEWKPFFQRCLKSGWNMTPHFPVSLWNELLQASGMLGDELGVILLLEEMLDVHADIEHLDSMCFLKALNAVEGQESYNYVKKYLFHVSEAKAKQLSRAYTTLRKQSESIGLKDNDKMFYHVLWHNSIRQPQSFSPRQQYFDYTPSANLNVAHNSNAKIETILKDKIERWKAEGVVPADYEHTDKVYDKSAAYKNIIRKEKWKKWPKIVKDARHGYTGDP